MFNVAVFLRLWSFVYVWDSVTGNGCKLRPDIWANIDQEVVTLWYQLILLLSREQVEDDRTFDELLGLISVPKIIDAQRAAKRSSMPNNVPTSSNLLNYQVDSLETFFRG